jgi:hypothetical protein
MSGFSASQALQRLLPVDRRQDVVALAPQRVADQVEQVDIVVNNEHLH